MEAALYCYVWDLQPDPSRFLRWAAQSGFRQLNIASTYHAGWFVHPGSPTRKAFFAEDGVAYFHPTASLYQDSHIKPPVATICQERDWLREAVPIARDLGIRMISWTIGTHNTRLGLAHPESCSVNCFGDPYPHTLCPAIPGVRAYLLGLVQDLVFNVGMDGIDIESFGYGTWRHGHHHERDLTGLENWEARLMDLCFHAATMAKATEAGVDAEGVRRGVSSLLTDVFENAPSRPQGHPDSWEGALEAVPGLAAYKAVCSQVELEIMAAIHGAIKDKGTLNPGGYSPALEPYAEVFSSGVYGLDAAASRATVAAARAKVPERFPLQVGMRLGCGVPGSEAEFKQIVQAVEEAGADRVVFYNASESPPTMLKWAGRHFGGVTA